METTNFENVIAKENEIFFMIEDIDKSTLHTGSLNVEEIDNLNSLEISNYTIQQLELTLVQKIYGFNEAKKSEWTLYEILAMIIQKNSVTNFLPEINCFVFYIKDEILNYVGSTNIKDLDQGIDTSLYMISEIIYK
jgi:hypothetical protein